MLTAERQRIVGRSRGSLRSADPEHAAAGILQPRHGGLSAPARSSPTCSSSARSIAGDAASLSGLAPHARAKRKSDQARNEFAGDRCDGAPLHAARSPCCDHASRPVSGRARPESRKVDIAGADIAGRRAPQEATSLRSRSTHRRNTPRRAIAAGFRLRRPRIVAGLQCASTASSSSATMLVILIIGLTAGPAVSL